jgi:replicative DNA helicase
LKKFWGYIIIEFNKGKKLDVSINDVNEVYSGPVGVLWEMLMGEQIHVGGEKETVKKGSVSVNTVYDKYMNILANGYKPHGIPVLDPTLQLMLESYKPGNLVILAAATGGGKSSFATHILKQTSVLQQFNTAYFSLEMTSDEITESLMASIGGFNRSRARLGKFTEKEAPAEISKIEYARDMLVQTKDRIHIDDRATADMSYIKKRIKQLQMKFGIDMVIVDHAGLISGGGDSIYESSTYVYNELKKIAKDLNVCLIALAQFSRKSTETKNAEPELHWLKGGSSIEQAADVVLMIQNLEPIPGNKNIEGIKLCVKKNRSGGKYNVQYDWNKASNIFTDVDGLGVKEGIILTDEEPELIPIPSKYEQAKINEILEKK